ncbi:MAG: YceD family protein [Chitinophagales bacterium]
MKDLREYQIPFVGLKLEVHHFNFVLEEDFFAHFENSLVKQGKVFIDLAFDKRDRLFVLNFDVSGAIETDCDRCGQMFSLPIHGNYTIYVKVGDEREEDTDNEDVVWIGEGDSILELSEIIYEFVHLSIPIKKTHPDRKDGKPGCDPEILKLLGTEESDDEKKEIDPRWDILNNLNSN